ncbi:NUDIX hydrolase [Pseudarthrobacter sp. PS3-L1]|uniref:NUDIX hydrolase n=1 Tax=Pseudarthrobacter sp. PS3-L1 TaxID=3046207 RepID=UPI0024B92C01|nr:NUDIX hydrolase [Pseudarthrobacter sp. PS3-L1]MDJ0319197.1 NUDIX hydrolase [Pseudarthrobacter sp. PS3-L1]
MPQLSRRLFDLPTELTGAAQSWLDHGERTPRAPRFASSVVLLRDSPAGLETWLGYRPGSSPLGVLAFPGGSLESDDDASVGWLGPSPRQWAEHLGTADVGLARRHVAGAIRELFEETGVLLAGPDLSTTVEATTAAEWMKAREAVATQEKSFSAILTKRGLSLRTDLLKPLVNWLSPDFAHRRFNTRYFAATIPVNQQPSILASKGVWGRWVCATGVIRDRNTTALGDEVGQPNTAGLTLGQLLVPGSEIMLEKMAASNGCIAYLSYKRKAHVYQPQLITEDGRLMLEVEAAKTVAGEPQRER